MNVYSRFINNGQNPETNDMPFNAWMGKKTGTSVASNIKGWTLISITLLKSYFSVTVDILM